MSLFIVALAFPADPELVEAAKVGILSGSLLSALAGFLLLRTAPAVEVTPEDEEDYVDVFTLGAAGLKPVKPCPRCPIPSVDQASGAVGPDPLDILRTYRVKPALDDAICFGMNCIVTEGEGEQLTVGQQIGASLAF